MGDVGVDWSIVGSIKSMPSVESVGALVDVVGVGVKSDVGWMLNFSVVVSVNLEGSVIGSKAMGMVEIGVVWCGLIRLISVGWGGVASCSQACIFIGIVIELCICVFFCFCVWGQLVVK